MVWFEFIKKITVEYWQSKSIVFLFLFGLLMIICYEKDKLKRYVFLWYTGLVFLVIYNPVTYLVGKKIMEEATFEQYYQRFFTLAPVLFIIAYGFTKVMSAAKGIKKLLFFFVFMAFIALGGTFLYNQKWFTVAENRLKVPQDVVTICDTFDSIGNSNDEIKIMAPVDVAVYLRQVESRFSMPYSRYPDEECYELTNDKPDMQKITKYAADNKIEYLVVGRNNVDKYLNYGYKFVAWTNDYALVEAIEQPTWELTEYSQASGDQGMCYILKDLKTNYLIVIDGGDPANEMQVRKAIKNAGGRVNTWILTHYHQDHCSVFNAIYEKPQGITIDRVFATDLDADYFHSVAQEWDDVETFDRFVELTEGDKRIKYISRGQHVEFRDGLSIEFFNACDDVVYENAQDVPNNDSLVFQIKKDKRSMLVCADCHDKALAEYMMKEYGEKLQSDILQLAHHGNNSIPVETGFYELVAPEVAIFDAPDWVLNGQQYTAKDLKAYLEEHGIRTQSFETAPNVFGF